MKELLVELTEPQHRMVNELDCTFPLFVGGYGSGKSEALIWNAVKDVFAFKGARVAIYAPTYDLLKLNLIPRLEETLRSLNVPPLTNKTDYTMKVGTFGTFILRSMDNPSRIVAYEVFRSHVDEADLLSQDKAEECWNRIIARNRQLGPDGMMNRVYAYSTPESFNFTYKRWRKSPGEEYKYVRAATYTNPFRAPGYIKGLRDTYPPELCEAYIEGRWVNLHSGNVYSYYDRKEHDTTRTIKPRDVLHISQDFNVGGCVSVVWVIDHEDGKRVPKAVDEYVSIDTEQLINNTRERYPKHNIVFYPDATGDRRTSNSNWSDIKMLKEAGFTIRVYKRNPYVKDRINAMNRLFYRREAFVNSTTCPRLVEAFEEHAWDIRTGMPEKHSTPASVDDFTDAATYFIAYEFPVRKERVEHTKLVGL